MASLQAFYHVPKTLPTSLMKWHPGHVLVFTLLIPALRYLCNDYREYIALGPGGTPATVPGYLRVKFLGLFALSNPYEPPVVPLYMTQKRGRLSTLPNRQGCRPKTRGIAPHRQTSQKVSPEVFALLSATISTMAAENNHIEEGTSCFEKHGPGLFSTFPLRRTCRGEICHAHPSDGSLHLTLHPADAKLVLEAGWGERHPLARGGWLERFVPGGFMMMYAPRNEEEVDVVAELIQAAAWWVGGEDIKTPADIRREHVKHVDVLDGHLEAKPGSKSIVNAETHTSTLSESRNCEHFAST